MMHLDTHVVVWLYAGLLDKFPTAAQGRLEQEKLVISPMVALELQYLYETRRTTEPGYLVVRDLESRIGLTVAETAFIDVAAAAASLSWTRDPFDRLIAAQAVVENVPLLTADRTIRANLALAVWG